MPVVAVNPRNGKFLNQSRGRRRGWTENLEEAQVFENAGKAKIAYNHATADDREYNRRYWAYHKQGNSVLNMRLQDIPPFETKTVKVVLTED